MSASYIALVHSLSVANLTLNLVLMLFTEPSQALTPLIPRLLLITSFFIINISELLLKQEVYQQQDRDEYQRVEEDI